MAEQSAAASPSAAYSAGVARGDWQQDPAQLPVLAELDRIHAALAGTAAPGLLGRLLGSRAEPPRGLYLWGGVGRGKTFLVDLFFDTLEIPAPAKRRTHFHRFMREVHAQLRAYAGERDPLATIARAWGRTLRVLVLDEFFVSDIGDAMLLARLLERLFAEGVVLVTTSNTPPDRLYAGGLQRARFLPAIELLKQPCVVHELASPVDYRLRALTQSPVYRAPLAEQTDDWLRGRWEALTTGVPREEGPLQVEGRAIAVRGMAEGHAWFDFDALCEGPRATADYIEVATEHRTVLLGGIPRFDGRNDDPARRFVHLVDELYDRHVNLVCTADAPPHALYAGERLQGAFERTSSRLIEMQSA